MQPAIGIEAETDVAIPGVADWSRDPQLAAPRLRSCRLVHSGSDDVQLELADAALHAEQQAVVGAARVVHTVEVDDAGFHQSAQLEQMMPIAAIASEPRGIEAEHRAHLSGAERCNQALEAGPLDGAARRAPEVVVDDLDGGETAPARDIDQLVLASLALEVGLHLLWRRLADIDDRLALQHGGREEGVMRRHRRPPSSRRRWLRAAVAPVPSEPLRVGLLSCLGGGRRRGRGRAGTVLSRVQASALRTTSVARASGTSDPIVSLLRDGVAVRKEEPQFAGDQQPVQVTQCRQRDLRGADLEGGATAPGRASTPPPS